MRSWFSVIAWALAACGPLPDPQEPLQTVEQACEAFCDRMDELDCPGAEDDPTGTPCETICVDTEQAGLMTIHPECRARQSSCEAMDRICGVD